MYQIQNIEERPGHFVEHVFIRSSDDSYVTFPNVESNTGPERAAYLAWLADGNEPEVIV